ncbi:MAG: Ig-like domain repeat protein [Anaerolineales bacterium]|nr:Ig-like domain repeat protein [Anaerolineales bacterium]
MKIHSGPEAAPAGIRVTIVATVTSVSGVPDGMVIFKNGGEVMASIPLVDGTAVLATTDLPVGEHSFKAEYQGTGIFERSASGNFPQSVVKRKTQTLVGAAPNPSSVGHLVTFSILVMPELKPDSAAAGVDGVSGPTGKVHLTSNAGAIDERLDLVNGAATFATDALRAGKYQITAKYLGDANYAASTSPALEQVVEPAVMAVNDAAGTLQGVAVKVAVLANDIDPLHGGLAVALAENATNGSLKINDDNTITYTPGPAFTGVATFDYVARDVKGNIDRAQVTVIVSANGQTNTPPQIAVIDPEVGATVPFSMEKLQANFNLPSGVYTDTMGDQDTLFFAFTGLLTSTHAGEGLPPNTVYGGGSFEWKGFVSSAPISSQQLRQPVVLTLTYNLQELSASEEPLMQLLQWTGTAWSSDGITVLENNPAEHRMVVQTNVMGELGLFSAPALPAGMPLYLPMVQR